VPEHAPARRLDGEVVERRLHARRDAGPSVVWARELGSRKVDLFAGIRVSDLHAARDWYERLLGAEPSFFPNDREVVWTLAEHRHLYIETGRGRPGDGLVTIFVEDLETRVAGAAERGIEPAEDETYSNGVRKVTYRDPDGNEVGFGGNA